VKRGRGGEGEATCDMDSFRTFSQKYAKARAVGTQMEKMDGVER
jgi:hypothetical protein